MEDGEQKYIHNLLRAACLEESIAGCCGFLAEKIHNGRARQQFRELAQAAGDAVARLIAISEQRGAGSCRTRDTCEFCRLRMTDFSVDGAARLGREMEHQALAVYKTLLLACDNAEEAESFHLSVARLSRLRDALRQECGQTHEVGERVDPFDSHCVPTFSILFK